MKIEDARALYSELLDGALDENKRQALEAFLTQTPEAARELSELDRTLTVLHSLPAREPSLDLWREFAPKLAAHQAAQRLGLRQRLQLSWRQMLSELSTGLILWTHALASRTHARLERYLLHDPVPHWSRSDPSGLV